MSRVTEIVCDGCGKRAEWKSAGRPRDWRRLHISGDDNRQWVRDVCSPRCASKVTDETYGADDRRELRVVRS